MPTELRPPSPHLVAGPESSFGVPSWPFSLQAGCFIGVAAAGWSVLWRLDVDLGAHDDGVFVGQA
jgi:hypothetical protein